MTKLLRKIINVVLDDQMILSVLDDQEEVVKKNEVPDTVVTRARKAQRPNKSTVVFKRPVPQTREELRRDLEQAARNTAAMPVE
jgi:hypothetical protein